mmetsp:Transcript_41777/g.129417  ORF Transcript_41777/g.129417 Transcript_41777/m.129417 type:complete len:242 (-) Transcript_41777:485-1210(-)
MRLRQRPSCKWSAPPRPRLCLSMTARCTTSARPRPLTRRRPSLRARTRRPRTSCRTSGASLRPHSRHPTAARLPSPKAYHWSWTWAVAPALWHPSCWRLAWLRTSTLALTSPERCSATAAAAWRRSPHLGRVSGRATSWTWARPRPSASWRAAWRRTLRRCTGRGPVPWSSTPSSATSTTSERPWPPPPGCCGRAAAWCSRTPWAGPSWSGCGRRTPRACRTPCRTRRSYGSCQWACRWSC